MQKIKLFIPFIAIFFVFIFLRKGLQQNPQTIPSAMVGQAFPAFALKSSDKKIINQKIFSGKITVVHVFASWCAVCRVEHPFWMDLAKQKNLQIVGLVYKDQIKEVNAWLQESGNPYQFIMDDAKGNLAINLGVYGTPETFLIDAKGMIRQKHVGAMTATVWKNDFLTLLQ